MSLTQNTTSAEAAGGTETQLQASESTLLDLGAQQIMSETQQAGSDTQQVALDAPETDRSAISVEVRGRPLPTSPFSKALQKGGFDRYQDIVHEFGNSSRDLGPLGAAR